MTRIVHVAGEPIRVANRTRQRCSWCGDAIIDDDLSLMVSSGPPPEPYGVHVYPVGAFVAVEERIGMRQTAVIDDERVETGEHGSSVIKIPIGFCADPQHVERPKLELVNTNPAMLYAALKSLGVKYKVTGAAHGAQLPWPKLGFVRVQWGGRWMQPGVPMAARYRHTHWIGSWIHPGGTLAVFDINAVESGGWLNLEVWEADIVPYLAAMSKGSDGTWLMTHAIEVLP